MNKKQETCPNGHSNIHFASFYPNPVFGELTQPMICCLKCKKFLYEIESQITEKTVIRLDTKPIY